MKQNTKENDKIINEKIKYIGINKTKKIKEILTKEKISFKPLKSYDDTNYKVYEYVDIDNIEIYITNKDRQDNLNERYKQARPISEYLDTENEENIEKNVDFLKLLNILDIEKLKLLEEEQKKYDKRIPFEIKYKNNFIWQIYYSEIEQKHFMLFSTNDTQVEGLFYILMKKLQKRKSEKIYVPINHAEYKNDFLKKSEISDLENYLWLFTNEWPTVYEVKNKEEKTSLYIIGRTQVYENIKSIYKMSFENKEEAQKEFKLIKALFILQSNIEQEYKFTTVINEKGSLDFCYNRKQIKYENISEFIKQEIEIKNEKINQLLEQNLFEMERLELLKESVQKQNEEYLSKEKQIVTFLECKKTFFGRMSYFFKSKRKFTIKETKIEIQEKEKIIENIETSEKIEKKELYTIEDLLKICNILQQQENKYKNVLMDIKALENKKENLESKIKNATLYINEIESHKKSIFDFWKFTNKDEVELLTENKEIQKEENLNKLKKVFSYEDDIEDFEKKVDEMQRRVFSKNECDGFFAIENDIETFNILNKPRILKKDDASIEKILKKQKEEYKQDFEKIQEKDFDIFGGVVEDKTKIKILKNHKHREIEKDKYKVLNIHLDTTIDEYKENIRHYKTLIEEAYGKVLLPNDISIYKSDSEELKNNEFEIFNINPKEEIEKFKYSNKENNLYKINLKENMPVVFYSNIMFYDNLNETLPLGMDLETEVLLKMNEFEIKLISRKDFNINFIINEFENKVKTIKLYEYNIEKKETKNDR